MRSLGGDNQIWFFDGDILRSKKFPHKVLDLHRADYECGDSWGKVYLNENCHGDYNQRWYIYGNEIVCKLYDLRLDVYEANIYNGAKVGGCQRTGYPNQKWNFNGN